MARAYLKKQKKIAGGLKLNIFIILIVLVSLIYVVRWTFQTLGRQVRLPVSSVIIQSDFTRIDQNRLKQMIAPLAHTGFFDLDLSSIQANIQKIPWVSQAEVRRVWPDQLFIKIIPEQVAGRWGQDALLNKYGEILRFGQSSGDARLPLFVGSDDLAPEMLNYYQQANELLKSISVSISEIDVDSSGCWDITLNNGINLQLGAQELLTRLRRFVKVYDKLIAGHSDQVKKVDLRYHDGIAIAWKNKR